MLSLSSMKDGAIVPSEEDRKKLLTQMKVKTTLRSDKSWIQKKSDSEEEKNHSPLHSPLRSRKTSERASISPKVSPLNHRAVFEELSSQSEQPFPVAKQPPKKSHHTTSPSGYLIRGVFTKTVDKNAPSNNVSNGLQKSAKNASSTLGYKMSTEDYKKLAPYTVKRDTAPDHIDPPVSPDEQQKRTEAASSVLRQTAGRERSYVLSAAKKSNGSAAQEAPSFTVKRIEIEDDTVPRSRSQTMPASSWINNRGKSTTMERRSVWGVQRLSNASSTTSIDTGSRNQASKYSSGYSSAFNHFSSLENSNKQDQEKYNQTSGNDSSPKGSVSSPRRSEKNGKFQLTSGSETRDAVFSEDSWEGRKPQSPQVNQNSQFPYISPEASPKRSSFHYQTGEAETSAETHYQPKTRDYLNDKQADSTRYVADQEEGTFSKEIKYDNLSSTITEDQPATANNSIDTLPGEKYSEPTPISNDQDTDPKSSLSSLEKKTTQEEAHESPNETEYNKVEAHLAKSGSVSSEGSLNTAGIQTELPGAAKSEESALETARSGSISADSSVAPPESQRAYGSEADASRSYPTARDSLIANPMRSHRVPFYKDICDADSWRYLPRPEERPVFTSSFSTPPPQPRYPSSSGYDSDPTTSSKALLFVKESINSTEMSSTPRYNSRSMVDLSTLERSKCSSGSGSYMQCSQPTWPTEDICTYCGREIRNCPKIKIEKLNICCHEFCFRCGICHKPMGDLLDKIFIHRDIVHCDKCYEKLF